MSIDSLDFPEPSIAPTIRSASSINRTLTRQLHLPSASPSPLLCPDAHRFTPSTPPPPSDHYDNDDPTPEAQRFRTYERMRELLALATSIITTSTLALFIAATTEHTLSSNKFFAKLARSDASAIERAENRVLLAERKVMQERLNLQRMKEQISKKWDGKNRRKRKSTHDDEREDEDGTRTPTMSKKPRLMSAESASPTPSTDLESLFLDSLSSWNSETYDALVLEEVDLPSLRRAVRQLGDSLGSMMQSLAAAMLLFQAEPTDIESVCGILNGEHLYTLVAQRYDEEINEHAHEDPQGYEDIKHLFSSLSSLVSSLVPAYSEQLASLESIVPLDDSNPLKHQTHTFASHAYTLLQTLEDFLPPTHTTPSDADSGADSSSSTNSVESSLSPLYTTLATAQHDLRKLLRRDTPSSPATPISPPPHKLTRKLTALRTSASRALLSLSQSLLSTASSTRSSDSGILKIHFPGAPADKAILNLDRLVLTRSESLLKTCQTVLRAALGQEALQQASPNSPPDANEMDRHAGNEETNEEADELARRARRVSRDKKLARVTRWLSNLVPSSPNPHSNDSRNHNLKALLRARSREIPQSVPPSHYTLKSKLAQAHAILQASALRRRTARHASQRLMKRKLHEGLLEGNTTLVDWIPFLMRKLRRLRVLRFAGKESQRGARTAETVKKRSAKKCTRQRTQRSVGWQTRDR